MTENNGTGAIFSHSAEEVKNSTGTTLGRIGVLMGGPSAERPISFKSGQYVCEALRARGHEVVPVEIPEDVRRVDRLLSAARLNVAFIALHGTFGEDGTVQSILERLGIIYTGSGVLASRCGMNKWASRQRFQAMGLLTPQTIVLMQEERHNPWLVDRVERTLPYPLVVKPCRQGSSVGVGLVSRPEELRPAVEAAWSFDDIVLVEERIQGRELTVGILEDMALPVIEVVPSHACFDYEAKYQPGLTTYHVPAVLDEDVAQHCQAVALEAHRAVEARHVSRVDLMLNAYRQPVILEINTIPGLTSMSLLPKAARVAGIEFSALCERLVLAALQEHLVGPVPGASS